ncbi:MAG: hypothetical protein A2033_18650 [Bacteroidetes bacterium GWA2_31_9]|nr:MAG: hypothetical protein A2033_18650 [Bacteroidetes bacterium GWA2_31_9]
MITTTDLKDWANDVFPIINDLNITVTNLNILETEKSKGFTEIGNEFFNYFKHQQRFVLVIQLAKLFSNDNKNQRRNFKKLCNYLENESLDNSIIKLLNDKSNLRGYKDDVFRSREDILTAVSQIKEDFKNYKKTIKSIDTLRNKVYAHTDPERIFPEINNQQLFELVNFANNIFNTLFGSIFVIEVDFKETKKWDLRFVIEMFKKINNFNN